MPKRITKAEQILRELAQRSKHAMDTAANELDIASAIYNAHYDALTRLEQARESKPQKKAKKPSASAPAPLPADKEAKCGICGNPEDFQDHFQPSPNYHPFDPPKSVARAVRKSRQKKGTESSVPSSEIETVAATSAALAASGGCSGD